MMRLMPEKISVAVDNGIAVVSVHPSATADDLQPVFEDMAPQGWRLRHRFIEDDGVEVMVWSRPIGGAHE